MDKILLINKEQNMTSRDVVNQIVKIFNTKKVGHFGTLDPLATGVLMIGIGKYTKIGNLLKDDIKEYEAEVLVGRKTDTYDITGNTIEEIEIDSINKEDLEKAFIYFTGKYIQEVPIYSAVKVEGKKLYEYARNNEMVKLPLKLVEIFNLKLLDIYKKENKLYYKFTCKVSKGTYIRSLINDISYNMKIPMCMSNLTRTKQDKFDIKDSYTLEQIRNNEYKFLELKDAVDIDIIEIDEEQEFKIKNGAIIDKISDKPVLFTRNNNNIGIYIISPKDENKMKPFLIFD